MEYGKKLVAALAVRRESKAFTGGHKGPWLIEGTAPPGGKDGDPWTENPLVIVPNAIFRIVDIWLDLRIRGKDGAHFLPSSGGFMDQPAAMMDAFAILDRSAERQSAQ